VPRSQFSLAHRVKIKTDMIEKNQKKHLNSWVERLQHIVHHA